MGTEQRDQWSSRFGFIMVAAGSAVGLGNIWKFPYLAGKNGGGAFLLTYYAIVFTIGASVMLAEFAIGRAAQKNAVTSFQILKGGAWPIVGFMGVLAGFLILSFYSVVMGWTIAYIVKTATGLLSTSDPKALGDMFGGFITDKTQPLIYHGMAMFATVAIIMAGVSGGIEKACKVMMPALFVILFILIGRSLTLEGAMKGVEFYLIPDFSKLNGGVINAALGQAFFSLSLGMGCMITYGSYLNKSENMPSSALTVTFLDTAVASLAGLAVLPAVFAFGFDPQAGPGLTFITMPAIFAQMPGGVVWGVLFFVLLFFAALTSSISLLEVVVAYFVDKGMNRKMAALVFGFIIFLMGIPCSLSLGAWEAIKFPKYFGLYGTPVGFFDLFDYISSNILLPVGGILISVFVGWVWYGGAMQEVTNRNKVSFAWSGLWNIIVKFVAPIAIGWILYSGLSF